MQMTKHQVAANPQTKPTDFGCESIKNWLLTSEFTVAIVIITRSISWYLFYSPTDRRHCSKGAVQPMLKAVYIAEEIMVTF